MIKNYLSLIKFNHTIFALPFAIIGFFLATQYHDNTFQGVTFLFVMLCMLLGRSAAMAFNRYLDKDIDKKNERTKNREIPLGIISSTGALIFTIICSILFVITCYFINPLCFYLSFVALSVILGYSYTKRFTSLSHLVLGLGLSLAPIGAYLAVTATFNWLPLLFSGVVLFWVGGFDIIYSLQDTGFDLEQNLFSIPSFLGKKIAILIARIFHLVCFIFLTLIGILYTFKTYYWLGVLLFSGFLIYQHTLVKENDLSKINLAFFTSNGLASIIFAVFVLIELFFNQ